MYKNVIFIAIAAFLVICSFVYPSGVWILLVFGILLVYMFNSKIDSTTKIKNKKLKISNAAYSTILSALNHELKNPISIILGYSELLEDEKHRKTATQRISSQAKKLDSILNRLSLSTKLDNSLLKLEISKFRLDAIVREISTNLGEKYPNKRLILKLNPLEMLGDRTLIETVIINLVENALKYSNKNVKIIIKKNALKVVDDGDGIPKKDINLITKKFYRSNQKYAENSLGLGLFIAKNILKLHNIELNIKSKMQKGSSFGFKINKITQNIKQQNNLKQQNSTKSRVK